LADFFNELQQKPSEQIVGKMKQEINLLNSLPGRKKIIFPARMMMQCFIGFIIVLIFFSFSCYFKFSKAIKQLTQVETQKQQLVEKMTALQQQYPEALDVAKRSQTLTQLTGKMDVMDRVVTQIKTQIMRNQRGLAPLFQLLGERIIPGVWLTRINIEQQGVLVFLQGHAYFAKDVLTFMKRLNQDESANQIQFYLYRLEKNNKGLIDFELRTREGRVTHETAD